MKKGVYLLCSILAMPLVSAQELFVGGEAYPIIILVPLMLVILVWLVILLLYLRKNVHKISLMIYNVRKYLKKKGLEKVAEKIKIKPKIEEKEEEKKEKKPEKVRDLTVHVEELSKFEKRLPRLKRDEAFKTFNTLTKKFFSDLLAMDYEFTDEELITELQKRKRGLVKFANILAETKYAGKEISKEDIIKLLDEFKSIVEAHARKSMKGKIGPKGAMAKLITEDKKIFENIKMYIDFLRTENRKKQIQDLLQEERSILKDNIRTVKSTYNKILELYVQLSPTDRARMYPELIEFYESVNKAIFSSVYGEKSRKKLEYFEKELERLKGLPRKEPVVLKIKHFFSALAPERKKVVPQPFEVMKKELPKPPERAKYPTLQALLKRKPKKYTAKPSKKLAKTILDLKKEEAEIISRIRDVIKEDVDLKRQQEAQRLELLKKKRERIAIKDLEETLKERPKLPLSVLKKEAPKEVEPKAETKLGRLVSTVKEKLVKEKPKVVEETPKVLSEGVRKLTEEQQALLAKIEDLKKVPEKKEEKVMKEIDKIIKKPIAEQRNERSLRANLAEGWRAIESGKLRKAKMTINLILKLSEKLSYRQKKELSPAISSLEMAFEEKSKLKKEELAKKEETHARKRPYEAIKDLEKEKDVLLKEIEKLKSTL